MGCMLIRAALAEEGMLPGDGRSRTGWKPWLGITVSTAGHEKGPGDSSHRAGGPANKAKQVRKQLTSLPLWHRGFLKGL